MLISFMIHFIHRLENRGTERRTEAQAARATKRMELTKRDRNLPAWRNEAVYWQIPEGKVHQGG